MNSKEKSEISKRPIIRKEEVYNIERNRRESLCIAETTSFSTGRVLDDRWPHHTPTSGGQRFKDRRGFHELNRSSQDRENFFIDPVAPSSFQTLITTIVIHGGS